MSEPKASAETVLNVVADVRGWHVLDERIGAESWAYAVTADGGSVLIDPLPLTEAALASLEPLRAICLTAACHQRSAWRLRREFGVQVHAPRGSREMDEEPDARYGASDALPGGLVAVQTPGPEQVHFAFLREQAPAVLFCADLFMRDGDGELGFVPAEYHEDPQATRESARRLLDLPFTVLCLAHGAPITTNPRAAIRRLLG
jgi:glyoxylase-like metal-dependent hydrolase (beta-lactamase superfamily II)